MEGSKIFFSLKPKNDNSKARSVIELNKGSKLFESRGNVNPRLSLCLTTLHKPNKRGTILSIGGEGCDILLPPDLRDYACSFTLNSRTGMLLLRAEGNKDPVFRTCRQPLRPELDQDHTLQPPSRLAVMPYRGKHELLLGSAYFLLECPEDLRSPSYLSTSDKIEFCKTHKLITPPMKIDQGLIKFEFLSDSRGTFRRVGELRAVFTFHSGDHLALKEHRPNSEAEAKSLKREIEILKKLRHVSFPDGIVDVSSQTLY